MTDIHSPLIRSDEEYAPVYRSSSSYNPLHTFQLPSGQERHYQQQYGDMYFLRLAKLKPAVEEIAVETWEGFSVRIARWVRDGMGRILRTIAPLDRTSRTVSGECMLTHMDC